MDGSTNPAPPLGTDVELAQVSAGDSVGRVDTIKGDVFVTRTDGSKIKAATGLEIFQGDVVETDADGAIGIVFADDSTFSLAEAGQMTIDEMVYDPGGQQGTAALSVAQGVFTFVSGQIAKTAVDAMVINTPTATLGIRGTSGGGKASPTKGDVFSLFQDAGGGTGEIIINTEVGFATLNTPFQTTRITSKFALPSKPIIMPESAIGQFYGAAIAVAPPPPTPTGQDQQESGGDQGGDQGAGEGGDQTQERDTEQAAEGEAGADAQQQLESEALVEGGDQPLEGDGLPVEGDGPEGDNIEAAARLAAEQAVQEALAGGGTAGDAAEAAGDAALAAAIAEARANGISDAEIQAGANAFQDALAQGGNLDDAFEAAMAAGETAGLQAAIQFDQAIQQAQQQGVFGNISGAGDLGGPQTFGVGNAGDGGDQNQDGGGDGQSQSDGGLFGGDGFGLDAFGDFGFGDTFTDTFYDPLNSGEVDFDPFSPENFIDPYVDPQYDPPEENISPVTEDDVVFGETFYNTSGDDTFTGNTENTEYVYDQTDGNTVSASGGGIFGQTVYDQDVITDDGGTRDRLTFEALDSVGIKMNGSGDAGFMDFHIYSEYSDTSSLSTVLTYIQIENTVEDIQGSVDSLTDLDAGIVVKNAMDLTGSETAYILAGSTSADNLTISDSNSVGALLFGKDGNDTLTGSSSSDEVLYGGAGNDVLDGKGSSTGGDSIYGGLGNDTINVTVATGSSAYDGGDGTDTLNYAGLSSAANFVIYEAELDVSQGSGSTVNATDIEILTGTNHGDTFSFSDSNGSMPETVTGGTGNDTFTLSNDSTVTSTLIGGNGNDIFNVGSNVTLSTTLDGGGGTDVLGVRSTSVSVDTVNFEAAALIGSSSDDSLTMDATTVSGLTIGSVSGGAGTDTLTISAGVDVSSLAVSNVETITDSDGTDTIQLGSGGQTVTTSGIETIVGGSGSDNVTLASSGSTYINAVETLTGSTGSDNIYLLANGTYTIDGGDGTDYIRTTSSLTASLHLTNVEELPGTAPGPYVITLLNSQNGLFVRGSGNTDSLTLSDGGNTVSVYGDVDSVTGGTGADHVTVTSQVTGLTYNLAGGADSLTLGNFANSFTASNIETISGGNNTDTITLGAAQGSGTVDGGGGTDTVTLANGTNSLTLANMETVVGGTGTDVVTLGSGVDNTIAATNMETISGGDGNDTINLGDAGIIARISGGGGNDTVNLANGANDVDFFGTETINGGTGADIITSQDSTAETINGGGGNDTIAGSGGNDRLIGATGADRFVFSGQLPANLGNDTLVDFSGATNFGATTGEGDKIVLDTSNLGIGSIVFDDVTFSSSAYSTGFASANATVITIGGEATDITTALGQLQGAGFNAANAVVLFHDTANSNTLSMYYTEYLDDSAGTTTQLATFDSITTVSQIDNMTASDFDVQA
jgi:Ca2+-binding RTX toxin-like protein